MDGLEVCRAAHASIRTGKMAVIMLSAKCREADRVVGLGLGRTIT